MLGADYKVLSNVMASRLSPVLQRLIHPDQTGFIKGRQKITDNISLLRFVREHRASTASPGAVVFLDQEKAFDRVHWAWRDHVLAQCGFGPWFRSMVSLLHSAIRAQVQINGHLSSSFPSLRGTRQGDPLSPLLFALLEEPFACTAR